MAQNTTQADGPEERESAKELAEDARIENPDPTTARETFELELMEEKRSKEGEKVTVEDEDDA